MRHAICATIISLAIVWLSATASAESELIGSSPLKPGKAGFSMSVHVEAVGGNGYQPVYLDFVSNNAQFGRDRHIDVTLSPRRDYGGELCFDLHRRVRLPEGQKRIRLTLYVPKYGQWDDLTVRLSEEGREIDSSHVTLRPNGVRIRFLGQVTSVGVLVASDRQKQDAGWKKCPDIRTLVTVLGNGPIPEDVTIDRLPHAQALKRLAQVQPAAVQFRVLQEESLHESWLAYSQLDVILVAQPVLERIAGNAPREFKAISDWAAAGGNLWVFAANGSSTIPFLEKSNIRSPARSQMLPAKQVPMRLNLTQDNDTSLFVYESYNGVVRESQHYSYRSRFKDLPKRQAVYKELVQAGNPIAATASPEAIAGQFSVGSLGLGRIVSIDAEDPFPGSFHFWHSVLQATDGSTRLNWIIRNGIDVPAGNDNYWMWLMESVGQPPVKSFLLLNTMFVVIVGPLGYFFFRSRGRLYLLYFFAPALAMLVTASLFCYALLADGTKTMAKVRKITLLDPLHGYAVDQSRQTYYAVFGSGQGLTYPADAVVYPVRNLPVGHRYNRSRSNRNNQGQIALGTEVQQFKGRFLPPRAQVQYLVTRPRQSSEEIAVDWQTGGGVVSNHLPGSIRQLVACSRDGQLWSAADIPAGGSATLRKATTDELASMLDHRVLPELGEVPQFQDRNWGARAPGMQTTALESELKRWSRNLPVGCFVAVADDVGAVAAEDAVIVDSVHVLMGKAR